LVEKPLNLTLHVVKKSFGEYRWLAGKGRYEGSLWLGGDHLLVIENSGFIFPFSESYRRIDFKNIQTVSVATTRKGLLTSVLLIALLALFGWGIIDNYSEDRGLSIFWGVLASPILIALIFNWAKGPTTICRLQTAVQILKLKPLNRLKTAQRFMADLAPFCDEHQSALKSSTPPVPGSPPAAMGETLGFKIKELWPGSPLVVGSLVLVMISSAVSAGELFIKGMPYYFLDALLSVAAVCLIVTSAARIARFRAPGALRWAVWGNVVLTVIGIVFAYGTMFFHIIADSINVASRVKKGISTELSVWSQMADADMQTYGSFGWVLVCMSVLAFLLALIGLPAAGGRTRTPEEAPPAQHPPPPPPAELS
jgi:hypothetical protein